MKNRVHLDLNVGGGWGTPQEEVRLRVDAEATLLEELGAAKLRSVNENKEYCVVLRDPEGNEFCVQ